MKRVSLTTASAVILVALMLLSPAMSAAQTRAASQKSPATPTNISERERTIQDLLFFPFTCINASMTDREQAWQEVTDTFGTCEDINGSPGLHANDAFDFTYRGVPISICYYDWYDRKTCYFFFFKTRKEADQFYNHLVNDVIDAGIPLTKDRIYGGMSNRKRPVGIFRWVSVDWPVKVREPGPSNIEPADVVGMYKVEFDVFKKKK